MLFLDTVNAVSIVYIYIYIYTIYHKVCKCVHAVYRLIISKNKIDTVQVEIPTFVNDNTHRANTHGNKHSTDYRS